MTNTKISKEEFEARASKRIELERQEKILFNERFKIKTGFQCQICKDYFDERSGFQICDKCAKTHNKVRSITIYEPTKKENKEYNDSIWNNCSPTWQSFKFALNNPEKDIEGQSDILHFCSKDRKFSIDIHIIDHKLNIFSNKNHIIKEYDTDDCDSFYLYPE